MQRMHRAADTSMSPEKLQFESVRKLCEFSASVRSFAPAWQRSSSRCRLSASSHKRAPAASLSSSVNQHVVDTCSGEDHVPRAWSTTGVRHAAAAQLQAQFRSSSRDAACSSRQPCPALQLAALCEAICIASSFTRAASALSPWHRSEPVAACRAPQHHAYGALHAWALAAQAELLRRTAACTVPCYQARDCLRLCHRAWCLQHVLPMQSR